MAIDHPGLGPDAHWRWPTPWRRRRPPATPPLEISTSRHLLAWLDEQKLSIALTTYQIGKLFLLGLGANGRLSVVERTFNQCMGLAPSGDGFYMSSLYQIWRFQNLLGTGQSNEGYDRLYVPQVGYTTGALDVHDMAEDADGRLVFVNTLYGCLAGLSEKHSFKPLWRPPFLRRLAAEDCCHLNGLSMRIGRPAFVTALGRSDVQDGWRKHRADGGLVMDVASNETVLSGLSMPHSPRWRKGRLWLLNSGKGELGEVEPATGRFRPVTFCPGYLRGLDFHGDHALVGLSKPRTAGAFCGLPLEAALSASHVQAQCGVQVIDLRSGQVAHWLRLDGLVEELYDVMVLPGVRCPMVLGFKSDEIQRVISVAE